jgi:hypothetical protein
MSRAFPEPARLKLERAPGCDLCGAHHRALLKRFKTWVCWQCSGLDASSFAEVDAYALHPPVS